MACIIKMASDDFLDNFLKKFDYKKFNFLLVSENIQTTKKYKNVYSIPSLLPPPNIISEFISNGPTERYAKKYYDYISTPRVEAMITILVKLAIIDNSNVILLCSKAEDEFKYLDLICQYIETVYGVNTYSYKKYKKDPEKCEKVSDKVKKKASKILNKKIANIQDIEPPQVSKKQLNERFKSMSRKDLKQFLKSNSIKFDKDDSKKDLRKLIINEVIHGNLM